MEERGRCVAGHGGECRAAWQAWGVVLGICVDMVEVSRLGEARRPDPRAGGRLFTEGERGGAPAARVADPRRAASVAFVVAEA